jgi:uncharacterized protein (TIGR00730 family)
MKQIKSIGVYCSSKNVDGVYKDSATDLGHLLAKHKMTMIFGGGSHGLMGEVANAAMSSGGKVIGFMPDHLKQFEEPNWGITELHMVDSMHTRKRLMFENADAFFILPGGFGTLDETFEIITWRQLKLHEKPIIFININDYWSPLKELAKNIFDQKFAKAEDKSAFRFVDSVEAAINAILKAHETSHEPLGEWV